MDRLEAMSLIVAVTETGSFSAAARLLKTPVATVSRKVADLEARLKAELFQRSSRTMKLTDAGQIYVEACRRIIEQVDDAERELSGEYRTPKGGLAVTSPWGLGHLHLVPLTVEFLRAYPDISLRLLMTDRVVDVVEEKIDIALRIGPLPDSNMIASRVGSIRVVVCPRAQRTWGRTGIRRSRVTSGTTTVSPSTAWPFRRPGSSRRTAVRSPRRSIRVSA